MIQAHVVQVLRAKQSSFDQSHGGTERETGLCGARLRSGLPVSRDHWVMLDVRTIMEVFKLLFPLGVFVMTLVATTSSQAIDASFRWWSDPDLRRQITSRTGGQEYVLGSALDLLFDRFANEVDKRIKINLESTETNKLHSWVVAGSMCVCLLVGGVMLVSTRKYRRDKEREMEALRRRFQEVWGGHGDVRAHAMRVVNNGGNVMRPGNNAGAA